MYCSNFNTERGLMVMSTGEFLGLKLNTCDRPCHLTTHLNLSPKNPERVNQGAMIFNFLGISLRLFRFFRVLSKLGGMAIYGTLEVVLKPPTEPPQGVKNFIMDVSTVADIFEINTLQHWCTTPCVIKTQRYGYIRDFGGSVESLHRTVTGCEKPQNG